MGASTLNAAAMTERLIDAAIYYEQCDLPYRDSARKELSEARSAIEAALSAAKPPASGVDAVREALLEAREYAPRRDGIVGRIDAALASLSPAATPVFEAGPVAWRYPKRWGEGLSFEHPGKCFDDDGNEVEPTPLYLAKPASSPAGGDVREAFETCAAICEARAEYFDRAPSYREWTDAARSYRATAKEIRERAALSPSTSAAEPVEQYRWRDYGTDNWSPWFEGPLPQDCEVETRTLYATPPAPAAVDGRERDRLAKLVESMIEEPTFAKSPHARMAIAIAASNVRRGRLLTSSEKFDNLTSAIEEDDPDLANRLRACLATDKEGA